MEFSHWERFRLVFCCSSPHSDDSPFSAPAYEDCDALSLHSNYIGRQSVPLNIGYKAWFRSFFVSQAIALPLDCEEEDARVIDLSRWSGEDDEDQVEMERTIVEQEQEELIARQERKARRKAKRRAKKLGLGAYEDEESASVQDTLWEEESNMSTVSTELLESEIEDTSADMDGLTYLNDKPARRSKKRSSRSGSSASSSRKREENLFDPRLDTGSDRTSPAPSLLFSEHSSQSRYQYLPEEAMSESGVPRKHRKPKADRRLSKMSANTA